MKREQKLVIDLKNKMYEKVRLKQMDTTVFEIKILEDNKPVDLTGQTVDIIFTKPNDTIVQQLAETVDINFSTAIIPLKDDCLRQAGEAKMELEVKNTNSEVVSSFFIPVYIERTSKENVNSDNTPNYFEEFARAIDELVEYTADIVESLNNLESTVGTNEQTRISAENARISAETVRVTAENLRIAAEEARIIAENSRIENENTRISAESSRVTAENARVLAETSRASAEASRQSQFQNILDNADIQKINSINEKIQNLGDEFDPTKNYSEGQFCIKDNILYKANEDIIAGPWDSTQWTATTIAAELESRIEFELVEEVEDEEEETT